MKNIVLLLLSIALVSILGTLGFIFTILMWHYCDKKGYLKPMSFIEKFKL